MFTKLRMSVDEAMAEFAEISKNVYEIESMNPDIRSQRLRKCLEDLLERKGMPLDALLVDGNEQNCPG
jgi:hypothetical protein